MDGRPPSHGGHRFCRRQARTGAHLLDPANACRWTSIRSGFQPPVTEHLMSTQAIGITTLDGKDKAKDKNKDKGAGANPLARAVALHLAGKREEALKQLQGAVSSGQASAEIYRAMGHI